MTNQIIRLNILNNLYNECTGELLFIGQIIGASGFEPPTSWSQTKRSKPN